MAKYILTYKTGLGENNAGSKAGGDAENIARACGYEPVVLYTTGGSTSRAERVRNMVCGVATMKRLARQFVDGDVVLLQYPLNRVLLGRICRIVRKATARVTLAMLIHDIDFLRDVPLRNKGVEGMRQLETALLGQADVLIAHNPSMIAALQKENLPVEYISLGVFDYLYDGDAARRTQDATVVVAGNLLSQKAGYLYAVNDETHHFGLSLYGSNFCADAMRYSRVTYHGSFRPDELIAQLQGTYGLVWDGDTTATCSGNYGKYLRVNNPHKVSLYLAAGLPVVLWKEAALCSFIEENSLGFGVASLDELDEAMAVHAQQYATYAANVARMREKVCTGGFLKEALQKLDEMRK